MANGNYSLSHLQSRVEEARTRHHRYISDLLRQYEDRQSWRQAHNVPVIGWCGMGRAGKDTAAEWWCKRTQTKYPGSASMVVLPIIADSIGITPEEAFAERHRHREFWIHWCHAFRYPDPTILVKMCLGGGDVAVGIRGKVELLTVRDTGVVDYLFWVDRDVPVDPTVEYAADDCTLVIPNRRGLAELYTRLEMLVLLTQTGGYSHLKGIPNGDETLP